MLKFFFTKNPAFLVCFCLITEVNIFQGTSGRVLIKVYETNKKFYLCVPFRNFFRFLFIIT